MNFETINHERKGEMNKKGIHQLLTSTRERPPRNYFEIYSLYRVLGAWNRISLMCLIIYSS